MKLKSLHIKGFKSFANDTKIHFREPIIGIVGPNGSGKSNIIDSIRWVLGEQKSKGLRLDKMLDVIFNGTKSKKKAGMAQVSMTFENSKKLIPLEYDEVKVSRILYNTNESEYRINDVPCRLKDIRDLFLNTGIGSNSYAIIELGMVDDILLDKDHSRRRMFEQAAGIAKYKVRKHETLNKLKNTQNDLDRIEDILFELEANLKSLERQAKRTKKYYELKEEYKDLSIKKSLITQKEAIEQEKKVKSQLLLAQENYNQVNKQLHEQEAEVAKIKKDILDQEQVLSAKQKDYNEVMDKMRAVENNLEIKKQNKEFNQKNIERTFANLTEFRKSLSEAAVIVKQKEEELQKKISQADDIDQKFQTEESNYKKIEEERQKIQGANNQEIEQLKELETKKFEIEKSIIELRSNTDNARDNFNVISNDLNSVTTLKDALALEMKTIVDEITEKERNINALKDSQVNIENQRTELNQQIENYKSELNVLQRKMDAHSNEFKLLKDMVDNLEGFPESAKFLIKNWEVKKPLLSDIIQCDEQFRNAIELYLEPYLNYFVLDSVTEARSSIDLLKRSQKGKSQFFILSSFDSDNTNVINLSQYGQAAINVVKCDDKYYPLLHHLLHNVVLVDDSMIYEDVLPNDNLIYISKSGSTNRTVNTLSGGSIGLFDGKRIGRKSELDSLKTKLSDIKDEIVEVEGKLQKTTESLSSLKVEDKQVQIQQIIEQKNQLNVSKAEIQTKTENALNTIEDYNARLSQFESHQTSNNSSIGTLSEQLELIEVEIAEKKKLVDNQTGIIDDIVRNFSQANESYNQARLEKVKHQTDIDGINNELTFRKQQSEEYNTKIVEVEKEQHDLEESQRALDDLIKSLENDLFEVHKVKEEKGQALNQTEQSFFSSRNIISEKEDALKLTSKNLQNLQLKNSELKDELSRVEYEIKSAVERIKIEFNLDIVNTNVDIDAEDEEAVAIMSERYAKVKKRLDNYGEINPMAVEAFDEINERFVAMKTQRDDILEAEKSLKETIKEIDNDAREKFMESFYLIRDNFKDVFRSLFSNEDDCDLILLDAEDPLDSKIEIVAKPKGKKPKVLSQLSGGEKTLTAIALLFSLYLLKPAPFCIFDEVDAPLDDVNIHKFSKLIKRFSKDSQFIIVTHNKSTMAGMDTLYGVYMQEQGISGISQVDFRDYEHNETYQNVNV